MYDVYGVVGICYSGFYCVANMANGTSLKKHHEVIVAAAIHSRSVDSVVRTELGDYIK